MIYYLGKFIELNGLVVLGCGLVWGLYREDLPGEMKMLGLGSALFLAGYLLERKPVRRP